MKSKNLFKVGLFAFASMFLFGACSDDNNDNNGTGTSTSLPSQARSFVSQYFGEYETPTVEPIAENERGSTYIASFVEGVEIEFDANGQWTDIEGNGKALPQAILDILPPTIVSYVLNNHPSTAIEEIERKSYGYKVELLNDADLMFDTAGEFLSNQANAVNSGSVSASDLPLTARNLISNNLSSEKYLYIAKVQVPVINATQYKVYMTNGYKLKFDAEGNWYDIEADDRAIPTTLVNAALPEAIKTDLNTRYPNASIESLEKTSVAYEIELLNGADVIYNLDGSFQAIDQDSDKGTAAIVDASTLPQVAQDFVTNYFPQANGYRSIIKNSIPDDGVTYEVFLNNNVKMDLDATGNWLEVEAKTGALPQKLIDTLPIKIGQYLTTNQPNVGVVEISKERSGYKLELANDYELEFDLNGNLTKIED